MAKEPMALRGGGVVVEYGGSRQAVPLNVDDTTP